jgi:hypothetical protein
MSDEVTKCCNITTRNYDMQRQPDHGWPHVATQVPTDLPLQLDSHILPICMFHAVHAVKAGCKCRTSMRDTMPGLPQVCSVIKITDTFN